MTIDEYFGRWMRVVDRQELMKMNAFIKQAYSKGPVYPNIKDIYRAFKLCDYDNLNVVIIGQDPYPQKDVATGLCFANKPGTTDKMMSPSLIKIKDSLLMSKNYPESVVFDPTLESWAKQGILLLNSALTVQTNRPGSHSLEWRPFISKLLKNLSEWQTGIVYVLFGTEAQSFLPYINARSNHIIKCNHPAYYCRKGTDMPNIFKDVEKLVYHLTAEHLKFYTTTGYGEQESQECNSY